MTNRPFDNIILTPADIDLSFSPMRDLHEETYVLGAFNPGMSRLPNGNIILMVRIAEALKNPIVGNEVKALRWDENRGFTIDKYPIDEVDISDPRHLLLKKYLPMEVLALTSLSWILPVELNAEGTQIKNIHYDKIISPKNSSQEYGIEDARISLIDGKYFMTVCTVSSERHATTLYSSEDGLNYRCEGIILDHQNKDMLLFEGCIEGKYYALTRPLGMLYFATNPKSNIAPGPGINMAESLDLLHWKPCDKPFIRQINTGSEMMKLGGGAQPIKTEQGWLVLFHGVEKNKDIGIYRTYWALLNSKDPLQIIHLELNKPLLESKPSLTAHLKENIYINDVVFTTGIVVSDDKYIVASGELDLCVRITHIPKTEFHLSNQH